MAQLLDELHVDVRAESKEEQIVGGVPEEQPARAEGSELVKGQEEGRSVAANQDCSLPDPEPSELPGPSSSAASQEHVQPPDITSSIGQRQLGVAVAVADGEKEQRSADILDQVPLTDRLADTDSQGPMKPPRQFTVEPDIVASTKKHPPSRPPPPVGGPPPRPPPPARNTLPSKKSQETLRPSGLEGEKTIYLKRELNLIPFVSWKTKDQGWENHLLPSLQLVSLSCSEFSQL